MATTPIQVELNMISPYKTVFLHYFDHYDVTNGHFARKGHPQKLTKLFSQLNVYLMRLRGAILW